MKFQTPSGGTLVHPTSLHPPMGTADFRAGSRTVIIDLPEGTHPSIWQVLPAGPDRFTAQKSLDASYSSICREPHILISPDILVSKGLIDAVRG